MDWAETIKSYRRKSGMLQKQLAYAFDVDVMTVSRWERGVSEPSRLQKSRIKDLVTARKDPALHPYVQQLASFNDALSVINLAKEEYLICNVPPSMCSFDPSEVIGQNPKKFMKSEVTQNGLDALDGFSGVLRHGLMFCSYVVRLDIEGRDVGIEYSASVLKLNGFDPIFVHRRAWTDAPATTSVQGISFVYEDDLPLA